MKSIVLPLLLPCFLLLVELLFTNALSSVRYRARVAYDGSGFEGWQLQRAGKRTVQGCLEEALCQRFNQKVRVVAAGRTDAGVHARGQAIHFDLEDNRSWAEEAEWSVNRLLPPEIRIWSLEQAPAPLYKVVMDKRKNEMTERTVNWNVLYESTKKLYSYRISLAPVMDPMERHFRWHPEAQFGRPIDSGKLERLVKTFEGEHNFRAFAGAIEQLEKKVDGPVNTVRTVYSANLVHEGAGNYRIDFLLKGALYKQVRNMVGAVVDVCRGSTTEEEFRLLLDQNKEESIVTRSANPSKPAPPEGLCLEYVFFDNDTKGF